MVELRYPIVVKSGALSGLTDVVRAAGEGHRVAIITDRNVGRRYAKRVGKLLAGSTVYTISAGERHKNRKTWATLTDRLLDDGFGRDTTIVALGGGVVGDLAGFVAATYMRGVPVVQVPTTLLAMVDASVGGKTGVDTRAGKNLVGAFHQPSAVVIDPDVLKTLPADHIRAGFAEIIKHGVVADAGYFAQALSFATRHSMNGRDGLVDLTDLVRRSVAIKASVVARDERESGVRKVLNFGHTLGHAIEASKKFAVLHGYAVAMGMVAEARIAEAMGIAGPETVASIREACGAAGLPATVPRIPVSRLLAFTRSDKKARGGLVHYSLPKAVGEMAGAEQGWSLPVSDATVQAALA
ncbi:MAG TPA: 3-dehydroquinate synthase [Gemmatimonadaceae bacterium]